jgi:hypothetical protein
MGVRTEALGSCMHHHQTQHVRNGVCAAQQPGRPIQTEEGVLLLCVLIWW